MAAFDRFQSVVAELPGREREMLNDLIHREWEELLAARSEEARVRLVERFVSDIHDRIHVAKR